MGWAAAELGKFVMVVLFEHSDHSNRCAGIRSRWRLKARGNSSA
jgi:hypothetical protein